ncbi:uncharacterized protein PHA67_017635 [Liasis olivaceus]
MCRQAALSRAKGPFPGLRGAQVRQLQRRGGEDRPPLPPASGPAQVRRIPLPKLARRLLPFSRAEEGGNSSVARAEARGGEGEAPLAAGLREAGAAPPLLPLCAPRAAPSPAGWASGWRESGPLSPAAVPRLRPGGEQAGCFWFQRGGGKTLLRAEERPAARRLASASHLANWPPELLGEIGQETEGLTCVCVGGGGQVVVIQFTRVEAGSSRLPPARWRNKRGCGDRTHPSFSPPRSPRHHDLVLCHLQGLCYAVRLGHPWQVQHLVHQENGCQAEREEGCFAERALRASLSSRPSEPVVQFRLRFPSAVELQPSA